MACRSCNEFSRAHLLRQAAAQAGNGLPAIERGMPLPAGTGLDRRSFLLRSGGLMLSVYGASKLGLRELQAGIAQAAGPANAVLVNVFLDGGVDSLSVLAPVNDPKYQQWRPTLAQGPGEGAAFEEDTSLRWHPQAAPLDTLHREGKVTVFPGIGYGDPDQSHFTSRHYWEVGALNPGANTGWLGRLIDIIGVDDNPLQGLSLDGHLSPTLATASKPVAAIDGPRYDLWTPGVWDEVEGLMFEAASSIGSAHQGSGDVGRDRAGRVIRQAMDLRADLEPFDDEITSPVTYPDDYFAESLAALAAMLAAGLPIRCVGVSANGGYDTHDNQEEGFANDLGTASETLFAFQRDLEARGLANRVVTLVWSEFGRRPEENGGGGTDHGAGGIALLIGSSVKGEMVGEFPGLDVLDEDDNLRSTSDFRAVYCSLLEQWFNHDADAVIPGASGFARPTLIA